MLLNLDIKGVLLNITKPWYQGAIQNQGGLINLERINIYAQYQGRIIILRRLIIFYTMEEED